MDDLTEIDRGAARESRPAPSGPSTCHACGSDQVEPFFAMRGIPVSSCILMESSEGATAFGRGDLELAVCHLCGFVFNHLFRPDLVDYTMPYEESQAFSPRFRSFQQGLVERLTEGYALGGKEIFEIGCGKGAFLEAICRHAGASGLGIDPAYDATRVAEDLDVRVHQEFFDDDHTHLTGDLICCRHTLEHIQPVAAFVSQVRRSAEQREGSVVFFEIPDVDRILDEGAFWDIYYEHCSYFTLGSLASLFRTQGFEVLRLEKDFDDQYLLIDARPGAAMSSPNPELVSTTVAKCRTFGNVAAAEISHWRTRIEDATSKGETVVLWGAGSKSVGFLSAVGVTDSVAGVVDINPFKQGTFLPGSGHAVIAPESLVELDPDLVIVMNPIYVDEITSSLRDMGLTPDVLAVGVPPTDPV